MSQNIAAVEQAIKNVTTLVNGSNIGARLEIDYDRQNGYWYVMFAVTFAATHENKLLVSVTDEKRLLAHWKGFVENITAVRQADKKLIAEALAG